MVQSLNLNDQTLKSTQIISDDLQKFSFSFNDCKNESSDK